MNSLARPRMTSEVETFRPFPHNWQSVDYVSGWIEHDVARDPERRPLLRQMLSSAPFARDAELAVLVSESESEWLYSIVDTLRKGQANLLMRSCTEAM